VLAASASDRMGLLPMTFTHTDQEVVRFYVDAGALLRRRVRREIELAALRADVDVNIVEGKGLVNSVLYVQLRGSGANALRGPFSGHGIAD
jgi:hypothetical protein